jgi:5-(carboxyamino)imidazole ribonucleotide synthase
MEALDYVGVLALELFEIDGKLIANEFAPRVHNSGHWTIEGAETSQFENHLRAILDLPLGATTAVGKAAMVNFIGGLPVTEELLAIPQAHLHLYDKAPRKGRKVAHATVRTETTEQLTTLIKQLTMLADQVDDS